MYITLKNELCVLDGTQEHKTARMPAGKHELVEIQNPYGHQETWLVVKGTMIGAAKRWWKQLFDNKLFQVEGKLP